MTDTTYLRRLATTALAVAAGQSLTFNGSATLDYVYATLVTSGTGGSRQLEFRAVDAKGNVIFAISAGATQAASLTKSYAGADGVSREAAFVGNQIVFLWPDDVEIPNGGTFQVLDTANIDAAGDTIALAVGARDDG